MYKLKTLKDFESEAFGGGWENGHVMGYDECKADLRYESIEYIKILKNYGNVDCEDGCCRIGDGSPFLTDIEGHLYNTKNIINWIMYFFNINEKDLK